MTRQPDDWSPQRLSELLDAATGSGPLSPELAVAIERASAELTGDERAIVGQFLQRVVAAILGEATQIERGFGEEP